MKIYTLLLAMLAATAAAQPQPVIFDCDLGGDIDDAFALALLLCSQEEIEIIGITTGHGYTEGRSRLACKILHETGMGHIPVYTGESTPSVVGTDTVTAGPSKQMLWADGFDQLQPQPEPAADFILRKLNEQPGEITLITVGPLDNIAAVLDKDPRALQKAKQVIAMLGSIEVGYDGSAPSAEWNVKASIEAAKRMMNSGADITLAPLDITDHVILGGDYLTALGLRDTPLTDALGTLYALWYRHADWAVAAKMFDGVAVGMLLWPELYTTRPAHIIVDEEGFTKEVADKAPNCTIGLTIKHETFINRMMRRILEQDFKP
jgi:inosine-uridine nucleoside N-ribohydrolase